MKYSVRLQQSKNQKLPTTYTYSLLEEDLLVFLRPWGSQDYNQRFLDEVTHYLSSALADVDVTTPFDFEDHLTTLGNKLKVALLIAHDFFYKFENKSVYSVGFEASLLFRLKNEIAWASIGRFDLYEETQNQTRLIHALGSDLDLHQDVLLPIELLGLEKDFSISCGSIQVSSDSKLTLVSIFGASNLISANSKQDISTYLEQASELTSLWSAQVKID